MNYQFQDLSRLFNPSAIALIGASDRQDSIGFHTMQNITEYSDYSGELYFVNPAKDKIGDKPCYKSVADLPEAVDVALIVIPASGVIEALQQAGNKGIPFAIILTSGFSEAGEEGKALEQQIAEIVKNTGIRVYGPNCPGICNIAGKLGMTFSPTFRFDLHPGPIGVATQGGGLGRNVLQNMVRGAGFAMWSSSGNEADLQVADFIYYMADDESVQVIITLMEGIKDGPRFAAALAHAAEKGKPVIGLKVGKSDYGAKAAQSHTASITGSAEVNSTVFRQFGMIEVDDLDELVDLAALFIRGGIPQGDEKIAVFASSGGATSLCSDKVGTSGLTLADFSDTTLKILKDTLPEYAAINNPVDTTSVTVSAPDKFRDSLLPVAEDPNVGLVLIPIAMDYDKFTENTARLITEVQQKTKTPICPIWMSERAGAGYKKLSDAGIIPFRSLRNMGLAIRRWLDYGLWKKSYNQNWQPLLFKTNQSIADQTRMLDESEAKTELANSGLPVMKAKLAKSPEEAIRLATDLQSPLAIKIVSPDIIHKSDIGGVKLNVTSEQLESACTAILQNTNKRHPEAKITGLLLEPMAPPDGMEVFIGVSRDPVFGYTMTFGLGGLYVEIFKDVTRRMLPVTKDMALEMINDLKSAPLLLGTRGQPARDLNALTDFIVSVSDYIADNTDRIEAIDINPVWVGKKDEGAIALDAVIEVKS